MSLVGALNTNPDPARGVGDGNPAVHTGEAASSLSTGDDTIYEKERETTVGDEAVVAAEVEKLARQLTRQSTHYSTAGEIMNPFTDHAQDSSLDPSSENFNARKWMKTLLAFQSRDPERYPKRTAGISFKNLSVHGFGSPTDYQKDVGNAPLEIGALFRWATGMGKQKIDILRGFDGLIKSGEMLVVLGRPGSGCSTLLKTIAGEMNGIYMEDSSHVNYQGISAKKMQKQFRGEAIYTAETNMHFPQLTVGETLSFAARARAPRNLLPGVSTNLYADHMRDVVMAMLGLNHTINTRVGNDFISGVSGGERKRASQSAYDVFDKVTVLYEGRQIYFGRTHEAKEFFTTMGFDCPDRQTTADFLTSLTSPSERVVKPDYENRVPRTPDEFVTAWKNIEAGREQSASVLRPLYVSIQSVGRAGTAYVESSPDDVVLCLASSLTLACIIIQENSTPIIGMIVSLFISKSFAKPVPMTPYGVRSTPCKEPVWRQDTTDYALSEVRYRGCPALE
ncbi:ABC-transporter extracellular N-terminal-domain-containing protein [Lipomyces doorenjongii]